MEKKPEVQTGSNYTTNSVNSNYCLFCNSICANAGYRDQWLLSSSSSPQSGQISGATFLVRILLEIPHNKVPDQQLNFSDHFSTLSSVPKWLRICKRCTKAVSQAQKNYTEILDATKRFRSVQMELVNKLKSLSDADSDKQHILNEDGMTIDKCTKFAKEHNYTEFGCPFTVHDAESLTKLESTNLIEFTDVFPVKPEPDDQEMLFILPGDLDQSEHVEIEMNNLSSVSSSLSQQTGLPTTNKVQCVPCNKVFNHRQNLFAHNEKYHKKDPKKTCEFCGNVLANIITYYRHLKKHCKKKNEILNKKVRNCKKKNEIINKKVRKEVTVVSTEYKCGSCDKHLNNEDVEKVDAECDIIEVDGKKFSRCIPCNRLFNHRQNLNAHKVKYHKKYPKKSCEFCGRVLANLITYRRHKKEHCVKNKNSNCNKGKKKGG